MAEKWLIDANKLKWKLGQVTLYVKDLRFGKTVLSKILESYRRVVFEEIDEAPTVDAVEVVHGRWEDMWDGKLQIHDTDVLCVKKRLTTSLCKTVCFRGTMCRC